MKTKNRIKELKAAHDSALSATDITAAAYDDYKANSDYWEAYEAALDISNALWNDFIAAHEAYEEAEDK